jgi:hypothetical protein
MLFIEEGERPIIEYDFSRSFLWGEEWKEDAL